MSMITKYGRKLKKFLVKNAGENMEGVEDKLDAALQKVEEDAIGFLSKTFTVGGQAFIIPVALAEEIVDGVFAPLERLIDMIDGKEG